MALIQQIETIWSKDSRSAKKAEIRNSVPEIFEVPNFKNNVHQFIKYDEKDGFELPNVTTSDFNKNKSNHYFGALRLHFENDVLKVTYIYSPEQVGAPTRTMVPRTILSLENGEWGKVIYTGRFCGSHTGYGDWFYRKEVFNIANIEQPNKTVFDDIMPSKTFQDIKNLR